ncbi:hypothetical protein GCM10010201_26560 [Pilimelia columellifera subsp. columellifera]|uniref:Uncharacterized protein n=1 Tax=Pilimelia columellifera subsp. columellifera TaxID=706583 RepID=A0ABP6AX30_9ACTN
MTVAKVEGLVAGHRSYAHRRPGPDVRGRADIDLRHRRRGCRRGKLRDDPDEGSGHDAEDASEAYGSKIHDHSLPSHISTGPTLVAQHID